VAAAQGGTVSETRRMFRYSVRIDDQPHLIELTGNPVAVAAASDWRSVEFWAEHTEGAPLAKRAFQVFGTGHPLPENARWVGTCARTAAGLVWHLYDYGEGMLA